MSERAHLGAASFALRLAAIALVPMIAVGILAVDRIETEREMAATSDRVRAEVELQQDIAAIHQPAQLERIALTGLARIDDLGLSRSLVTQFSGIDFEAEYGANKSVLDERLTRLSIEYPEALLPDGTRLSNSILRIQRDLEAQRALIATFDATKGDIDEVFDTLVSVLGAEVLAEGATTGERVARPRELDALADVLTSAGVLAQTITSDILEPAPGAVTVASAVHDARLESFRELLTEPDLTRFDRARAVLLPLPSGLSDPTRDASDAQALNPEFVAKIAASIFNQFDYLFALEAFSADFHGKFLSEAQAQATESDQAARQTIWLVTAISVIAVLLTIVLLAGTVTPVLRLNRRARQIGSGDIDANPLPVRGPRVIRRLTSAMNDMLVTLHRVDIQIGRMSSGELRADDVIALPGAIGVSMRDSVRRLSDVTNQLHRSEQLASAILEQAADAIWTVDDDGKVRFANESTEHLTGMPARMQVGRPITDFMGTIDGETEITSTEGTIRRVLVSNSSIDSEIDRVTTVIAHDISERSRFEAELAHQARHDLLTGLPNRFAAMEHLDALLERRIEFALLFVDIDGFKGVNDTHGHEAGDAVLTEIAHRLSTATRATEFVARLGGDEFVVVQVDFTQIEEAVDLGRRLIAEVERPYLYDHGVFSLSASVGVARSTPGTAPMTVLRESNNALYLAKQRGRGRVECFDAELQAQIHHEAELALALREAIRNSELVVHLQPVTSLDTNTIDSAEALVRWDRPGVGLIPPGEFIPIAERSSLIFEVERAVLLQVCEMLAEWRRRDPASNMRVAVNVSGRHLIQGNITADLEMALLATGADPHMLEFELTETQLLEDLERATIILNELRAHGVMISIDDFGTGYSSMNYLRDLPVDALKIDQSFVARSTEHGFDATVIEAIVKIARSLQLEIVAEGVETQEQLDFVRTHGCHRAQGYLLARPMPVADAEKLMFATAPAL